MSLTSYPTEPAPKTSIEVDDSFSLNSINWRSSITSPTRTVALPSFSATPDSLPQPTESPSSPKNNLLSTRSIIYAAVLTSVVICIAIFVLLYRWCVRSRTKVPKPPNISKPAVIQKGLSTWSLDSQAGLAGALPEEKRVEWMEKGQPTRSINPREAMSARVLNRSADEPNCGTRAPCSNGTTLSRSDTERSVSSGGTTAKQGQDIAYGAIAVSVAAPMLDQRGINGAVDGALIARFSSPEQVFGHGDRAGAVELARPQNVVAKTREPLGGNSCI